MHAILNFLYFVIQAVLGLSIWIVIIYAVCSTLISFGVINIRNRTVFSIWRALEAVALPLLRPIRRVLPTMGPMDFSPFVFLVVVGGISSFLIPPFFGWLHQLVGPQLAAY